MGTPLSGVVPYAGSGVAIVCMEPIAWSRLSNRMPTMTQAISIILPVDFISPHGFLEHLELP
jgi:hypothetical protein